MADDMWERGHKGRKNIKRKDKHHKKGKNKHGKADGQDGEPNLKSMSAKDRARLHNRE